MASENDLAAQYGVSPAAVEALRQALARGGGRMAQFSHPDLGGMGQWSAGGMTQVGDMFNTALRDKVNALCTALAGEAAPQPVQPADATHDWWPAGLGSPAASGGQNGIRYAYFPAQRRVAVEQAGQVALYDSGEHRISGVSQQQSGTQDLAFHSQLGTVRTRDLARVGEADAVT